MVNRSEKLPLDISNTVSLIAVNSDRMRWSSGGRSLSADSTVTASSSLPGTIP